MATNSPKQRKEKPTKERFDHAVSVIRSLPKDGKYKNCIIVCTLLLITTILYCGAVDISDLDALCPLDVYV